MEKGFGRTEAYGETEGGGRPSAKPKGTGAKEGLRQNRSLQRKGDGF
ncbi:MAG: hypothetical protein IIT55_04095 [Bacteroidaceae bacterium]|nr:hypothetical protein [Bacteroidaceae bacterium]